MIIRRADEKDIAGVNELLYQVLSIHHNGRPDIFKANSKKYTDEELRKLFKNDEKPIFVCVDENDEVLGYAFCVFIKHECDNVLTDIKSLYIDDLCVSEKRRGQHIGKKLYEYVVEFAKRKGCYNITLNVWELNDSAKRFYEACGLTPQKTVMEKIL